MGVVVHALIVVRNVIRVARKSRVLSIVITENSVDVPSFATMNAYRSTVSSTPQIGFPTLSGGSAAAASAQHDRAAVPGGERPQVGALARPPGAARVIRRAPGDHGRASLDHHGRGKDDVFIFDRCGRLAFYVPFPISLVLPGHLPVVEDSLRRAYDGEPCGLTCEEPTERNPRNTDNPARRNSLGWRILHMFLGGEQDDESHECDERKQSQMRVCCHPNSHTESPYCRQAPSCEELGAACGS
ncbi:hypothetical protein HPB51_003976 [Rhipicephalus microplus]|uniref:Selenoprotein P N-terminal domain-containing protein n=1 Tax=Rhipicephalus microplus TaxID=6941 RepID=A0A9J6DT45_RHIMP|nr:hypothetical protein HPB51_003976 [Rhipicephalus microplus]